MLHFIVNQTLLSSRPTIFQSGCFCSNNWTIPIADSMEPVFSAFADVIRETCGDSVSPQLVSGVRSLTVTRTEKKLDSLLALAQTLNQAILLESKRPVESEMAESDLDIAVRALVEDYVIKSDDQINRALDQLLKRNELFANSGVSFPMDSESTISMVESVLSEPAEPSPAYVPREPRLPGLPVPPGDQFGDWDEYRDDLDPGYRVREVYEDDHVKESDSVSQSTCSTNLVNQAVIDDELLRVACEPSPVMTASPMCDENDELLGAAPTYSQSNTPSMTAEFPLTARSQVRSSTDSPTFGRDGGNVPVSTSTTLFDYMGNANEVPRQPLPSQPQPAASRPIDSLKLSVVYEVGRTGFESSKEFDSANGVIVAGKYRIAGYLGSAAFSKAVKAVDLTTNQEVCLKIIKNDKDFIDQSLDEIKVLSLLKSAGADVHANCLSVVDYFYWKEHLIIVTELLLDNLYEFSKFSRNPANGQAPYFTLGRLQRIAQQVLVALQFVHSQGLIHCDLKPENILFKSYANCQVKVIDFGSSCFATDRLSSYVQSRCYRAPEVILGCLPYDARVDLWSLGCILAELWTGVVLFQNDSSQSLLARVMGIVGKVPTWMMKEGRNVPQLFCGPNNDLYVELDAAGVIAGKGRLLQLLVPKRTSLYQRMRVEDKEFLDFLSRLLQIDPALRMTAREALGHPWLRPGRYSDGLNADV